MQRDSLVRQSSLMPTEKVETSFPIRKKQHTHPSIKRTQFSFMLSCVCIFYNVQEVSLDELLLVIIYSVESC